MMTNTVQDLEYQLEQETELFNNRKNMLSKQIEHTKKIEGINKTLSDINNNIKYNNTIPRTSIPNYDDMLKNNGFKLIDNCRSSRLGDTFYMLNKTPSQLKEMHRNKVSSSDCYDNYYALYDFNNKKYIFGCARCLQFWDHNCETKVYEFDY
jgi:hypothetical protein